MATAPTPSTSENTGQLVISVLGPVRAQRAGVEAPLGGRRQRGVLARLAMAGGQVVPVERVIDDLWSGEPPVSASNTLQSYVSNLRKALGGEQPVIERVGDGYRIRTDQAELAATRFEQVVGEAMRADARGGPAGAADPVALLDEALGLWEGPALGDLADEPWAKGEAFRLDELRLAATEERFRRLLDRGLHAVVVGELAAAVDEHPLRERLAELLVLALYRSGRQAEALQAFERTRDHLGEELGLDPGPELTRLAAAVEARDPALDRVEPATAAPAAVAPAGASTPGSRGRATGEAAFGEVGPPRGALDLPPAVTERRTRSPFVGRDAELAALHRALDVVTAGDRRMAVLAGEPGMGKTRLAQVFARQVHDLGGHVLWGRCTVENLVAYQPAAEALRTALRAVSEERVRSIVEPRPALRLLLPDATANAAEAPPSRTERYELYEGLAEVIGGVAVTGPVVFVIDDIQWADRSTLSLVEHLVRQDRSGRLLVVATLRRPAGRPTVELDRLLADLRRDLRLESVEVGGMDATSVAALLQDRGVEVDDELATTLRDRTGGNPFFLESLADQGGDLSHLGARELPASVRDLIDLRMEDLDPETARVLTAAAIIGMRVDLDLLGAVAGLDPDALLDQVDAAVAAGLLAEDEDIGWVTFPHALVRQSLIARTTRNREAQLHLRVADALAERPTAGGAPAVAQHLLAAGRLCPPLRAAEAALEAGRQTLAVFSDDEARTWGRRALDSLSAVARDDAAWAIESAAQLLVAEASRRLGQVSVASAALDRVTDDARTRGDGPVLARAAQERALAIAGVGFAFGAVDHELLALLDEALDLVADEQVAERSSLLAWSSIARNSLLDRRRQQELAARAIAEARRLPERPDLLALALLAERLAHAAPDGLDRRRAVGPEMVAASLAAGWTELVVVGMVLDVVDRLEFGDAAAARTRIDELGTYIEPFHRPVYDAYHLFLAAAVAQMEGRHEDAEKLSAEASELGEISHADNARHARAGQLFVLARDLGTVGELMPLTGLMVAEYPTMPVWLTGHATACAAAGELDEARRACESVFANGGLDAADSTWSTTLAQLAEVCWLLGEVDWCTAIADALEPVADRMAVTGMGAVCLGPLERGRGLALAGAGRRDEAIDALGRAIERADAGGIRLWLARSLAERAMLLDERGAAGDAEQAATDRGRAHELADELGVRLALGPVEYP